jgi:hypothetical protein
MVVKLLFRIAALARMTDEASSDRIVRFGFMLAPVVPSMI